LLSVLLVMLCPSVGGGQCTLCRAVLVQFGLVTVNHQIGVGDGKVCELNRADAGVTHAEYRHVDISPEFHIVYRKAFFARSGTGAPGQVSLGMGHTKVPQGIRATAVMNL